MISSENFEGGLSVHGLRKAYGGVHALRGLRLACHRGEVHGLVGENGAGKSTLIKILSGVIAADDGSVVLDGRASRLPDPRAAQALGIATVHQELSLIPHLSVAENLLLDREPRDRLLRVQPGELRERAEAVLAAMAVDDIDVDAAVHEVSLEQRQVVEIVKAFSLDPNVALLDEPTSALGSDRVHWLFTEVRKLADRGTIVILVSHRLDEVLRESDRITVMRGGTDVGTGATDDLSEGELVNLMLGRNIERSFPHRESATTQWSGGLSVREMTSGTFLNGVNLDAPRGEITGLAGLGGQGQVRLFKALFGMAKWDGEVDFDGLAYRPVDPTSAIGMGVALVPEDRTTEGLCLDLSVAENITLGVLRSVSTHGLIRRRRERTLVASHISDLAIATADPRQRVSNLSGGNQQKVLLARSLAQSPSLLLMYDPTRGVDIGTRVEIYTLMQSLAEDGGAVLFYSTNAVELAEISDTIFVLSGGRIVRELRRDERTERNIIAAMLGVDTGMRT